MSARASRLALAWAPALAYMALIWGLSSIQIDVVRVSAFPLKDKGVHFCEYGALGFLSAHAVRTTWANRRLWRVYATAVLITFAWGILDEFHQAFVPGRFAEVYDALADLLGAMTGAAAYLFFFNLRARRRARRRA